jgi:pilus assembly protein FimV
MISRILKWTLSVGVALLSPLALAIGLGELQLRSAMEERFAADIELLQIGDLNEHQLAVNLAPPEDFERAGLERDFQLADLRFRVDLSNPARPLIKVTSRRPMHEPYLNFLVELRWPSGRLLREYTALLDLPTFAGEAAPGKTSAATRPVAAEPRSATPSPVSATGAAHTASGAPGPDRVQVYSGDTLWAIAQRHQAPGTTIHQALQAIAAANPDAFIRGDINRIRRGAWLRIPDAAAMRAAAPRQVAPSPRNPPATPPTVESHPAAAPASAAVQPEGELRLTAATGTGATAGAAAGTGTEAPAGAATGVAGALEERDRLQRENEELRSRVRSLEAQLNATAQLVQIEAPGLAALPEAPAAPETEAAPAVAEPPPEAAAEASADGAPAAPTTTPADVAAATPTVQEPTPAPTSPAPEAEPRPFALFEQLDDWLIPTLGVTAALLLGLLVFAAMRRGSGVQQRGLELPREPDSPPPGRRDAQGPAALEPADAELFAAPSPHDEAAGILNEADVCLSFGHQEQAEELLREGLEKYPEDAQLHLKLLDVLAARGDRDGFETHLPRLAALGNLDAFAAAQALQSRFPASEQPPAAAPAPSGRSATAATEIPLDEFDLGLELDLDAAAGAATPAPATPRETAALERASLEDFDLGLEQMAVAEPGSGAAMPEPALEDLDLFEPGQEIATQLELASAYVEMGDTEGAREILDHVIEVGDAAQRDSARQLIERLG